ncbi:acylphosphatase [Parafrankia discariae]|nr:acylphosphatase [Parafrankia discariae]
MTREQVEVEVTGIVQGVGFRPFRLRAGHPARSERPGRQRR